MPTEHSRSPVVSVIMGVYNQKDFVVFRQAVDSILNQTFSDLEFIIYNDGSDEETGRFMRELAATDERIVLLECASNNGLAFSLNACIRQARGQYIARMDADDVSDPERLAVQVQFLETHPEYDWCGTNAALIDGKGVRWGTRTMPECPQDKDFLKFSPYVHPSVTYRASLFETEDEYLVATETLRCEDYEIFMRLHRHGHRGYNLQQILFFYREDAHSFKKRKFRYRVNEARVRYRNFKKMKLLFPLGWLYVLRPLAAALVPVRLIALFKKEKTEYAYETNDEARTGVPR